VGAGFLCFDFIPTSTLSRKGKFLWEYLTALNGFLQLALFFCNTLTRGPSLLPFCDPRFEGFWRVKVDVGALDGYRLPG
jgi:hypothetical protein